MLRQLATYCVVGGLNTVLGLALILLLMQLFHVNYIAANGAGYVAGFALSFVLNRRITFAHANELLRARVQVAYFAAIFVLAYLAQLVLLIALVRKYDVDARVAQAIALIIYTGVGFLGNRYVTFAPSGHVTAAAETTSSSGGRQ